MDFRIRKNFTLHIKLDHKSVGFVEFNSNYHVFFTDKKSDKPFQPRNLDITETTNQLSDVMLTDNEEIVFKPTIEEDINERENVQVDDKNIAGNNKVFDKKETDADLKEENIQETENSANETSINDNEFHLKEKTNENHDTSEDNRLERDGKLKTNENQINSHRSKNKELSVKLVNVNSDFMTATETETDQIENEVKRRTRILKRKIIQPVRSRKRPKTKRCEGEPCSDDSDVPISKTIQKVPSEINDTQATITRVEVDKLSVKKFLETFKPDANDPTAKKISISNNLSIRPVANGVTKMKIKMTKFNPEPAVTAQRPKLKMPVKFREELRQEHKVSIKLVHCDYVAPTLNLGIEVGTLKTDESYSEKSYDDDAQHKTEIPEVGREVLLENKDTVKVNTLKKTIVLKDLLSYNNVRIGHLAPKAPFYKIVKIDEVLQDKGQNESPKPINITLPNGTKLVSVNPLAHLLGNKNVADIQKSNPYKNKSYSYKPKMQDVGEAIVKAMKVLDKTPAKRKSNKKTDSAK
ncbi:uncharacterized protein LOC126779839 [Nymphalis io]|uniref:uncharacterized protein LOC126779839 n=1 Tax=Inachis io TaxID=171585 RepID=UPI0021691CCC|nr:uncharacterized protein LOC126779839 [Nymphalis io]